LKKALLVASAVCALAVGQALGQGGPPMITDDPGTPGDKKWEINLALAFEHRPGETAADFPAIDLNYGVGEHIQLTLQTAPVLLKREGHGLIGGVGRHRGRGEMAFPRPTNERRRFRHVDVSAGDLQRRQFLRAARSFPGGDSFSNSAADGEDIRPLARRL
jgi:hypothetical protein